MEELFESTLGDAMVQRRIKKKRMNDRSSPTNAIDYFDQYFDLGLPSDLFWSEDDCAVILYDLANFPLEMVLARMYKK